VSVLSLVVLAAGLGSRYGGLKQIEQVGPAGETLLDYTVYDAMRAGFKRIVFVIRQDMIQAFHPLASRFRGDLEVRLAFQHVEDAPKGARVPGRTKPWGTGHAVLAAEPHAAGPFAVCNADDFYGAEAFETAAEFLKGRMKAKPTWAIVGFPLAATLSPAGPVNRAVCRTDGQGWLTDIEEERVGPEADEPDVPVSMNFWCFTQDLFPILRAGFDAFAMRAPPDGEYLLPAVIRTAVRDDVARVRVITHGGRWLGLTHPEDRDAVRAGLARLTAEGRYPSPLWP